MEGTLPEQFEVGSMVNDRYKVIAVLGRGGMGTVLKVQDQHLDGAIVALKVLAPHLVDKESHVKRFRSEVALTRKLAHPNILSLYEFDKCASTYFISMEYVEGDTFKELLYGANSRELTFERRSDILLCCARALAFLHQHNIVHRDIKPENILVSSDAKQVKLADFGVARAIDSDLHITRVGSALGTPYYMAPESFRGEHADFRADIYGFGILAWEAAAGYRPFSGSGMAELAAAHISKPLPKIPTNLFAIPIWYQKLVFSCAKKRREDRPESMTKVVEAFEKRTDYSTRPGLGRKLLSFVRYLARCS